MQTRQDEILAIIERRGQASVTELAKLLSVSEVTIRSDLHHLLPSGKIRRVRGGVTLPLNFRREAPIEATSRENRGAKRRIGEAAASLVRDGETVFLDVGSTTTEVARALSPTLRGVTIVTNGLNIALELERLSNLTVIVTGGTLRPLQHSLVSPYAASVIRQVNADRLFLGCNGIDEQRGITNANHEEAEIKRLMVEHAQQVVVVADHTKLGQVSRAQITDLGRVDALITSHSSRPPPPFLGNHIANIQFV